VNEIEADADRFGRPALRRGFFLPLGDGKMHSPFDAAAVGGGHVFDLRPRRQRLGPGRVAAVVGPLAQGPGPADRLDRHEDRLAAEEDLVQAHADDPRTAGLLQDLEQAAGPPRLLAHPAAQGGTAGDHSGRQEDGQQGPGLLGAQTQGGGLDGEPAALGLGALEALVEPVPELLVLLAQALVLGEQFGTAGTGQLGVGNRALDLVGMVVGSLPTTAAQLGGTGHVAVGPEEDSGGIANPSEQG
jgi:hypothetical protein